MKKMLFMVMVLAMVGSPVFANDFKVNEKQWNALSADERSKIVEILKSNRLMTEGDKIVGAPGVSEEAGMWNPKKDLCKAACDVAAAAAAAACSGSTVAIAACVAAVNAAREYCKSRC